MYGKSKCTCKCDHAHMHADIKQPYKDIHSPPQTHIKAHALKDTNMHSGTCTHTNSETCTNTDTHAKNTQTCSQTLRYINIHRHSDTHIYTPTHVMYVGLTVL
jgi:hypothetical protein